jgi:hypothetical protein
MLSKAIATVVLLYAQLAWAQRAQLPAGAMQQKATTACTECHSAAIIVQQRLSKAAWAKEVDKMVKWGALVNATERDELVEYLSGSFPPGKPPYIPPRNASSKGR